MNRDGQHLKKDKPNYDDYDDNAGQEGANFFSQPCNPTIVAVSKKFYPTSFVEKKGMTFSVEPKKMTSVFQVGVGTRGNVIFQKLYYINLASAGMDGDFEKWKWSDLTFKKFYREMALRYTSPDQIVDGLMEILVPKSEVEKVITRRKGFYSQEDFDKVMELSLQKELSSQEIAEISKTSKFFVEKTIDQVELEGDFSHRTRGREQKFNDEHIKFIVDKAKELDGNFDLGDLKYYFDTNFIKDNLTISVVTIHKILKKNDVKFIPIDAPKEKRVTAEVAARILDSRKDAALTVAQILADDGILGVFYDEITFVNFQGSGKAWTFAEQDVVTRFEKKDRQVIVAIVAMTETGQVFYALHEGSTDTSVVTAFVTQILEELALHERKTIAFFGDNASWHSDIKIEPHLPHGVLWFKNAPATPQLNPVERVFTYVKKEFRKENTRLRYLDLTAAVIKGFESVTKQQVEAALRITIRFLLRAYCRKTVFVDYDQVKDEEGQLLNNLKYNLF